MTLVYRTSHHIPISSATRPEVFRPRCRCLLDSRVARDSSWESSGWYLGHCSSVAWEGRLLHSNAAGGIFGSCAAWRGGVEGMVFVWEREGGLGWWMYLWLRGESRGGGDLARRFSIASRMPHEIQDAIISLFPYYGDRGRRDDGCLFYGWSPPLL
jgi:hypothetical protein